MPTLQTIPTRELNRLVKQKILTPKSVKVTPKSVKVTEIKKFGNCKTTAKVIGNHVTVQAICNLNRKVTEKKHTIVPAACKGLKKKARKNCVKSICAQRSPEQRKICLKQAGLK